MQIRFDSRTRRFVILSSTPILTAVTFLFWMTLHAPLAGADVHQRQSLADERASVPDDVPLPLAIEGDTWFAIGPAPISGGQTYISCDFKHPETGFEWTDTCRVPVSGRTTSIAVNPMNRDDVWLGTANGGVWHSLDGGQSWTPLSDGAASLAIGAIALDNCKATCDIDAIDTICCSGVYAGTGENAIRRDTYYGAGLLVGTVNVDTQLFNFSLKGQDVLAPGAINNVVLDPTTAGNDKRLYVTLSGGMTASASESSVFAPPPPQGYGIYKSENRGDDWQKISVPGTQNSVPTDLEMHPDDSDLLFAGFLGQGIYRGVRDSGDGTIDWCLLNPTGDIVLPGCPLTTGLPNPNDVDFNHVEISISEKDPDVMYAMFGRCTEPKTILRNCQPSLYRSTNGGINWSERLPGSSASSTSTRCPLTYSLYTHALTIHPDDVDTVYLGALRLCKYTDGGTTLDEDFEFLANETLHPDQHAMVFGDPEGCRNDPIKCNRMYSANDGGFAYSFDGGESWISGNDDLQLTAFQSLTSSPLTDRIIGGTQDNGTNRWHGTRTWAHVNDGDSASTIMDLRDENDDGVFDGTVYDIYFYDKPRRSDDGGCCSWPCIQEGLELDDEAAFYPPLIQDPTAPFPIYFGSSRLYRAASDGEPDVVQTNSCVGLSDDAIQWNPVSPYLGCSGFVCDGDDPTFPAIQTGNVITAIAVAPDDPDRVYVGYYDGQIWRSKGDGPCADSDCWTNLTKNPLPSAPVTRIAVHPDNAGTAFATFSGFGSGAHVFRTTDSGDSWSARSGPNPGDPDDAQSLPGIPTNTISIEPSEPDRLWVGTDQGVYKSTDSGQTWVRFNKGMPNVPVYEISIDEASGRVFAGTHGRGAYVLTEPYVTTLEGWVDGSIWDIPVYGTGFFKNMDDCTIDIFQQNDPFTPCASGPTDVTGGKIETDGSGQLVTSKGGSWDGKQVAWACLNSECVGPGGNNVPIGDCLEDGNPVSTVKVTCSKDGDEQVGLGTILGCPPSNPPSASMSVSGLEGNEDLGDDSEFELTASLQVGTPAGLTRSLCTVSVPFSGGTTLDLLNEAGIAINESAACIDANVEALVLRAEIQDDSALEDFPRLDPKLSLVAPGEAAGQLIPSIHVGPDGAPGVCFDLSNLGVPYRNILMVMRLGFETLPGGAVGGQLVIHEHSDLGGCTINVPTEPGDSAADVAEAIRDAFQTDGIPGPHPACPPHRNPRDVALHDESIVMVMANQIALCVEDPGIGFFLRPEELANVHPTADAGGDQVVECTGFDGATVTLNGSGSSDPDSTPGTNDDIVSFEWFEDYGEGTQALLGEDEVIHFDFPVGDHAITLRVTDSADHVDLDAVLISVVDTTPPDVTCGVTKPTLWPPEHMFVDVGFALEVVDICDPDPFVEIALGSDEHAALATGAGGVVHCPDAVLEPDPTLLLRAERAGTGDGRVYGIGVTATDFSGNEGTCDTTVSVPMSQQPMNPAVDSGQLFDPQVCGRGGLREKIEEDQAAESDGAKTIDD